MLTNITSYYIFSEVNDHGKLCFFFILKSIFLSLLAPQIDFQRYNCRKLSGDPPVNIRQQEREKSKAKAHLSNKDFFDQMPLSSPKFYQVFQIVSCGRFLVCFVILTS